jgi:signal transduction histidine kinase
MMRSGVDFEAIFNAAPNAYMVVDRELCYVAMNEAYLAATHRLREELMGRSVLDMFPNDPDNLTNDPIRRLQTSLEQVIATGQPDVLPFIHYRIVVGTPEGHGFEDHYWSATHTPLFDAHGKVALVLQHTVDVTALHRRKLALDAAHACPEGAQVAAGILGRAEAAQQRNEALDRARAEEAAAREHEHAARTEAEQENRLKDEFLAAVSHELRTPLTSMLGWLSMLRERKLTGEKRSRALEVVERNARMQAQLIDDLLDVSRIVSGKFDMDVAPTDLSAVIESAADVVRFVAEAKGVRMEVDARSAGIIRGDARRLQQVIWNLLANAVKFTPKDGAVVLTTTRRHDSVEISVADTGIGVPPDFLPHAFERFQQSEQSGVRKLGGLGLGLSIVHYVVTAHHGSVTAASEGEGKGATFTVRLPVAWSSLGP